MALTSVVNTLPSVAETSSSEKMVWHTMDELKATSLIRQFSHLGS